MCSQSTTLAEVLCCALTYEASDGLNDVPPKRYIEVLNPSTAECDLIWK